MSVNLTETGIIKYTDDGFLKGVFLVAVKIHSKKAFVYSYYMMLFLFLLSFIPFWKKRSEAYKHERYYREFHNEL
jgi:hypothetical protein